MASCTNCGQRLGPDLRFCPSCGAEVLAEPIGGAADSDPATQKYQAQPAAGFGNNLAPAKKVGPFTRPVVIILANIAAVLVIAVIGTAAYFGFKDGGDEATPAAEKDKTSQQATSTRKRPATTATPPPAGAPASPSPAASAPPPAPPAVPAPAAPAPAPAPAPASPVNDDLYTAETNAMLDVVQADAIWWGGDSYSVITYDALNNTGTVLIIYYGDVTTYTELYMTKDQYGWYVYDDYSYTY